LATVLKKNDVVTQKE